MTLVDEQGLDQDPEVIRLREEVSQDREWLYSRWRQVAAATVLLLAVLAVLLSITGEM